MSNESDAKLNRAAAYGDGLFETIAIRNQQPRFWPLHYERLQTGCQRLALDCPSADELSSMLQSAIRISDVDTDFATARLTLSAAPAVRGYKRDAAAMPVVQTSVHGSSPLAPVHYQQGVTARLCATRLSVQPLLAGIKSLNRLEQVLARAEWNDPDTFEGITLDTGGRLICGTMSNVFIAKENKLITAAITRCGVSGIMRRHLIGLLETSGEITCEVRDIEAAELSAADEVFLCNSQFGIVPLRSCDAMRWEVGSLTRDVQSLLGANGVPECSV